MAASADAAYRKTPPGAWLTLTSPPIRLRKVDIAVFQGESSFARDRLGRDTLTRHSLAMGPD
jgi:hypothetical protein